MCIFLTCFGLAVHLCICINICVGRCVNLPLARWQVWLQCDASGPLGLARQSQTEPTGPQTMCYMQCSAPVLCFHADKVVLSSLWAKDLLCFHDSDWNSKAAPYYEARPFVVKVRCGDSLCKTSTLIPSQHYFLVFYFELRIFQCVKINMLCTVISDSMVISSINLTIYNPQTGGEVGE